MPYSTLPLSLLPVGAVVLQISCFSEAERIFMLAKDSSVDGKQLTSLVIPQITVSVLDQRLRLRYDNPVAI